jgi:hypothetical protein
LIIIIITIIIFCNVGAILINVGAILINVGAILQWGNLTGNKTVRHQDISAPFEKDSSAPRHFSTVEKKYQIGTAFSFKHT